ncbi:T9SS type A sorting domain-containing protein [Hymenobacter lutimineralis]|uniref:T9SS type A sorting domain-containing protein n=1 Tax=Hymenobacter lutimineralis TaxID=2606448 RepID=A0A5D6VAK6_9BACT|nr:T9SS type A sorting domain-containing protein [Hymenobacter lutimineralis]TYZ12566.1 T9SS type A sorting domain-containing protein [Hymenobacter lutimineralis]
MKKRVLLALLGLATAQLGNAQDLKQSSVPGGTTVCFASTENAYTRIAPPESFLRAQRLKGRSINAPITVTYTGFTPAAKAAFQYAVDIWASLLKTDVPIYIEATWEPLKPGVLGSAGPGTYIRNISGAPQSNVWYPIALAEKLAGQELNGAGQADVVASFSSTFDWYLGTDGNTPTNKYDLVSVVLHELGHGLGFVDGMRIVDAGGEHGYGGLPVAYDTFVENSLGKRLVDKTNFANPSPELEKQMTSNALYFNSDLAEAVNNNTRPRLYAPTRYSGGSSIAHLNENTYLSGDPNSLMTPQIGPAESIHTPGPITLKMFDEMGWFNTAIRHTPLRDTETAQNYTVTAVIESDGTVKADSPKLVYSVDGGTDVTLSLAPTGQPKQYSVVIPNPGLNHTIRYYLSAADNETGRTYTAPGKAAPGIAAMPRYTFKVGADVTAPEVAHEAPSFLFESQLPYQLVVAADDNVGVASVKVEYSVNGVAQTPIELTKQGEDTYVGTIGNNGTLKAGDVLTYRVVVTDVATAQNKAFNPTAGVYTINVVKVKDAQVTYVNQLNSATPLDLVGNGFSITTPAGFSNAAIHSLHPYPDGDGDDQETNFIYQLLVPIKVQANRAEATVKFDEIVLVEPGEDGKPFGSVDFYDYVVVEGSKDGTTWVPLADGYDARANIAWLDHYNSSTSGNNSTAVGTPSLFRARELNLRDKFAGGDIVQLRFRLFADAGAHGWGWAIDNLRIQDAVTGVAQELKDAGGFDVFPNPTTGRFTLQARLTKATPGLQVVVRNVLGQEVLRKALPTTPGLVKETLDLSQLANGLYLVSLGDGSEALTKRLMVRH